MPPPQNTFRLTGPYDLKAINRLCRNFPIRPLISKHNTGELSFEACAGTVQDPKNGKYKKQRKAFSVAKFGTVEEAFEAARAWIVEMKKVTRAEKDAVIALPMSIRSELLFALKLCEERSVKLIDMVRLGLETYDAEQVSSEMTFKEAAARLIDQKEREDVSVTYLRDLRFFYKFSGQEFNHRRMHEITADEIEDWLDEQEVGPVTWNNYRRLLGVLFSYAANPRNGWVKENVVEQLAQRDVKTDEVTALTVEQAKTILATAHRHIPRLVPYLCVSMFCGLRRSEAAVARWEDIDWETKSTRACGGKMRSVTSRFPHLEDVFIDWMKPIAQGEGPICTSTKTRREDLKKLRELTFDFDSNIFRHTFGTYHYRAFNNPQATIVEMGHTTPAMLFKHYRKPVPQTVAQKFWGLSREVVLKEGPLLNGADPQPG